MNLKSFANIVLLLAGVVLVVLLVYGVVALTRLWADTNAVKLSTTHRIGVTVLALLVALLLISKFSKLLFQGQRFHLTKNQLHEITAPLSIFHQFVQSLDGPGSATYDGFEYELAEFCKVVDKTCESPEWKRQKIRQLMDTVNAKYPVYKNHFILGIARLSACHPWLPRSTDLWLKVIAMTHELGALGQILNHLEKRGHKLAGVAALKYGIEYARSPVAHNKAVLNIPKLLQRSQKPHAFEEKRKPDEYLTEYTKQTEQVLA